VFEGVGLRIDVSGVGVEVEVVGSQIWGAGQGPHLRTTGVGCEL